MKPRTAIVAAMEREIRPLLRNASPGWRLEAASPGVTLYSSEQAVVSFAGIGTRRATLAAAAAISLGPVSRIISAGWAGGLEPVMRAGTVFRASCVIEETTGEAFDPEDGGKAEGPPGTHTPGAILVTVDRVISSEEKLRLRAKFSASLVDMEASAVGRFAKNHGVSFLAIKAVSDEYDLDIPDLQRFVAADGQFRQSAFALYAALRPGLWKPVARMARGSASAAQNLSVELGRIIHGYDFEAENKSRA